MRKRAQAADIEPFEATTRGMQGRYSTALDRAAADSEALSRDNEAALRGIESRATALLPEYDQAAADIAAGQEAELRKQLSRYNSASGRPSTPGPAEQRSLLSGIRDINLPLEQARIARQSTC